MNIRTIALLGLLSAAFSTGAVGAGYGMTTGTAPGAVEDRMIAGTESGDRLVATGAADAVTSPARIFEEMNEDTRNFGPGGLVTGGVRGGVLAAGQALRGGARMAIGIMDVLTSPFRD